MCLICRPVSRRAFCAGALTLPLLPGHTRYGLEEPVLRLAPSGGRRVAVTLDCCPGRFDMRIASVLIARKIPATIFVTAIWMRENPEALALMLDHPDCFTLENHGANHVMPALDTTPIWGLQPAGSYDAIRAEVENGADAVEKATGRRPVWYRAAGGLYSPQAIPFIEGLGFKIGGYSLNADAGASLPAAMVARRLEAAQDGDVTEGHINQPKRAAGAGIAAGLARLADQGVQFTTLDAAC
ncbi:polysaccharide deacetylase family protein [Acidocella sp.]|uniref:polysaccharide deacetylase family protein n=1 Tax=Acidocella sp. TaxID=50710 RepID=UPI0026216EB2|nr:polysaccharide deacetylase family protein [Acidocella sp.]